MKEWKIVLMDVTKDTTTIVYENASGVRKKVVEHFKYTQYNSTKVKTVVTYYDPDGNVIEIDEKW